MTNMLKSQPGHQTIKLLERKSPSKSSSLRPTWGPSYISNCIQHRAAGRGTTTFGSAAASSTLASFSFNSEAARERLLITVDMMFESVRHLIGTSSLGIVWYTMILYDLIISYTSQVNRKTQPWPVCQHLSVCLFCSLQVEQLHR